MFLAQRQAAVPHPLSSAAASKERLTLQEYATLNFMMGRLRVARRSGDWRNARLLAMDGRKSQHDEYGGRRALHDYATLQSLTIS